MDPELKEALVDIRARLGRIEVDLARYGAHSEDTERRVGQTEDRLDDVRIRMYQIMGGGVVIWALVEIGLKYIVP